MANITMMGAGSKFTIEILRDITSIPSLSGSKFTLVDIDEKRLKIAKRLVEKYCEEVKSDITVKAYTDGKKGLEGADFVISAVKVGGYGPLEEERKIAEENGYYRGIGDRVSCYYGGIGAYHQLEFLKNLAADMEIICPDAWLVQTANPVFEGTNYVTRHTKVKSVGVCHGHYGYLQIAKILGLEIQKVSAEVVGFNHCTWMTSFLYEGKDAYPLLDEWIENRSEQYWKSEEFMDPNRVFSRGQMSPGAIEAYRLYGLMPIGDAVRSATPWWHHTDFQTKLKWYGKGGGFDSEIGWKSYLKKKEAFREKLEELVTTGVSLMDEYKPGLTMEQHIPFINAVYNDIETKLVLNIPNNGCIKGIPDDVLVEVPTIVSGRGAQGLHIGKLSPVLMNNVMVPRMTMAENTLNAFVNGDRKTLILMLMNDPRTKSYEQAKGLIDKLLGMPWNKQANKHYR